jgi:hypothetical protein
MSDQRTLQNSSCTPAFAEQFYGLLYDCAAFRDNWYYDIHTVTQIFNRLFRTCEEPRQRSWYSDWLRAGLPKGQYSSPSRVKNNYFFISSRPALGLGADHSNLANPEVRKIGSVLPLLHTPSSYKKTKKQNKLRGP